MGIVIGTCMPDTEIEQQYYQPHRRRIYGKYECGFMSSQASQITYKIIMKHFTEGMGRGKFYFPQLPQFGPRLKSSSMELIKFLFGN